MPAFNTSSVCLFILVGRKWYLVALACICVTLTHSASVTESSFVEGTWMLGAQEPLVQAVGRVHRKPGSCKQENLVAGKSKDRRCRPGERKSFAGV